MDSYPSSFIPPLCVLPRCRLCRFGIMEDESAVVVSESGTEISEFTYTSSFDIKDKNLKWRLVSCMGICNHVNGVAIVCHSECLSFASKCWSHAPEPPFPSFFRATKSTFDPPETDNHKRYIRTRVVFAAKLSHECNSIGLPMDVWTLIAEYLVRYCAIVTAKEACSKIPALDNCSFSITSRVWAQYICLDGIRYIARLSNIAEDGQGYVCIWGAASGLLVDTIYISEDHLGIRQVIFSSQFEDPVNLNDFNAAKPGVWWKTISNSNNLIAESDGSKLRRIVACSASEDIVRLWPVPMPQTQTQSLHFHDLSPTAANRRAGHTIRMTSLRFNDPAVTGYSACWQGRILTFHAHMKKKSSSLYQNTANYKYAVWIYIPLDPGEIISDVWQRLGRGSRSVAILFKTNKNRVMTVGPHLPSWWPQVTWSRISTPTEGKARFYFNDSPDGVYQLATDSPAIKEATPIQSNSSPSPNKTGIGEFFYSSASLENIMEIIPCQKTHETDSPIIGLLIRYFDGTRVCTGQCRLDNLTAPLLPSTSPMLCLGFARARTGPKYPYVAKVELFPPKGRASYTWLDLPWTGRLEWWFSYWQCKIYHNGKESLSVV